MKEDNLTSILADLAESAAPSDQIDLLATREKIPGNAATGAISNDPIQGNPNMKASYDS